ncbi:hypothetical protein HK099_005265 [Clydaea vesicula]|uniref:Uncharacterized protein n=1 Tax=Clydaea vesicula TaxID=447962 RepID=A0AAD5XYQ4_9FUNG|nr:hypothetical protein HK099_005265 [Clydaea vesicula]
MFPISTPVNIKNSSQTTFGSLGNFNLDFDPQFLFHNGNYNFVKTLCSTSTANGTHLNALVSKRLSSFTRSWRLPRFPSSILSSGLAQSLRCKNLDPSSHEIEQMVGYWSLVDSTQYIPHQLLYNNLSEGLKFEYQNYYQFPYLRSCTSCFQLKDKHWIAYASGTLLNELRINLATDFQDAFASSLKLKRSILQIVVSEVKVSELCTILAIRTEKMVSFISVNLLDGVNLSMEIFKAFEFEENVVDVNFCNTIAFEALILLKDGTVCLWEADTIEDPSVKIILKMKNYPANEWLHCFFGFQPESLVIVGSSRIEKCDFKRSSSKSTLLIYRFDDDEKNEKIQFGCSGGRILPFKLLLATNFGFKLIDIRHPKKVMLEWNDCDLSETVAGIELFKLPNIGVLNQVGVVTWNRKNADIIFRIIEIVQHGNALKTNGFSQTIKPFFEFENYKYFNDNPRNVIPTLVRQTNRTEKKYLESFPNVKWPPLYGVSIFEDDNSIITIFQLVYDGSLYSQQFILDYTSSKISEEYRTVIEGSIEVSEKKKEESLQHNHKSGDNKITDKSNFLDVIKFRDVKSDIKIKFGGFNTNIFPPRALSTKMNFKSTPIYQFQNLWKFLKGFIDPSNPYYFQEDNLISFNDVLQEKVEYWDELALSGTVKLIEYRNMVPVIPNSYPTNYFTSIEHLNDFEKIFKSKTLNLSIQSIPLFFLNKYSHNRNNFTSTNFNSLEELRNFLNGLFAVQDEQVTDDFNAYNGEIVDFYEYSRKKSIDIATIEIFKSLKTFNITTRFIETQDDTLNEEIHMERIGNREVLLENNFLKADSSDEEEVVPSPQILLKSHFTSYPVKLSKASSELYHRWLNPEKYYVKRDYFRNRKDNNDEELKGVKKSRRKTMIYQEKMKQKSDLNLQNYLLSQQTQSQISNVCSNGEELPTSYQLPAVLSASQNFVIHNSVNSLSFSQNSGTSVLLGRQSQKDTGKKKRKRGF